MLASSVALALAACGQKGPLYLPDKNAQVITSPAPAPPPPAGESAAPPAAPQSPPAAPPSGPPKPADKNDPQPQ